MNFARSRTLMRPSTHRSHRGHGRRLRLGRSVLQILSVLTVLAVAAACGGDDGTVSTGTQLVAPTAIPAPAALGDDGAVLTLTTVDGGELTGLVMTDHRGLAVYGVLGETPDALVCVAECLDAWVPVAPRSNNVGSPLDASLLGAIDRPDGVVQATYSGVPLYTWTGDSDIGITGGAGVAGIWYALTERSGFVAPPP